MAGVKGEWIYDKKGNIIGATGGGKLAAWKNKQSDPGFYSKIGKKGAESYNAKSKEERPPRGFAWSKDLAIEAGRKGGTISRRTKKVEK